MGGGGGGRGGGGGCGEVCCVGGGEEEMRVAGRGNEGVVEGGCVCGGYAEVGEGWSKRVIKKRSSNIGILGWGGR